MAANGIGSLVPTDGMTANKISRVNSKVYSATLSAQIQSDSGLHSTG